MDSTVSSRHTRHVAIAEDDEEDHSMSRQSSSNQSATIDLADAMDNIIFPRRRRPTTPPAASPTSPGQSTEEISHDHSVGSRHRGFSSVDTRSNTTLSAFSSGQGPSSSVASLHKQQSFSDARRAMQRGAAARRSSGASNTKPPPPAHPPPPLPSASSAVSITGSSTPPPPNPRSDTHSVAPSVSRQTSNAPVTTNPSSTRPRIRNSPHLYNFHAAPESPATMHWSRAPVHGSLPTRSFRAHTVTLVDQIAWLFAGIDESGCWNDVYCLDTETFQWTHPEMMGDLPPPCRAHSATAIADKILVFGGGDGATYYNHLYMLDTRIHVWTKINPIGMLPPPRRAHSAIFYNNVLYIFGGGTGTHALGDLWGIDVSQPFDQWKWVCVRAHPNKIRSSSSKNVAPGYYAPQVGIDGGGVGPAPRGYHTANVVNSVMVVYGGSDGALCFNDIWLFNLDNFTWKLVEPDEPEPSRMLSHTATQVGSYLFVIGGHDSIKYRRDVRLLNLITLKFEIKAVAGRPPVSRGYHVALFTDSRIFVFGGFDGQCVHDDVWILDLAGSAYLAQVTVFEVNGISDDEDNYDDYE